MRQDEKISKAIGFIPAVFKELTNDWIIEFYVINPMTKKLERKRVRLNRIRDTFSRKSDARKHCSVICMKINEQLKEGWNPFFESGSKKLYCYFHDIIPIYLQEKKKDVRKATYDTYKSFCNIFSDYLTEDNYDGFISTFSHENANSFMHYVYFKRDVSANCYNNYIKLARVFFSWMVENGYAKENHFLEIKPKRREEKKRVLIGQDMREKLKQYLKMNDPLMLIACELVFYSLIRPKEILNIKVKDICADYIIIRGEISKNHNTRKAAISEEIKQLLADKLNYNPEYYIFSKDGVPGEKKLSDKYLSKRFLKIKKEIGIPENMQLYSFRDTGITEMIKSGIDDLTVMQHADHSDLTITSRYARHIDDSVGEKIRRSGIKF